MQYANLRLNTPEHHALILKPPEIKVSSILLYQTERELVIEEEFPEYTRFDSTFYLNVEDKSSLVLNLCPI